MSVHALGPALRSARKARGLSVARACQQLGVSPATLKRWENGQGGPAPKDLATADAPLPPEPPVTEVGKSVWTPAVQVLVAENKGGGFRPAPVSGASHLPWYRRVLARRGLEWMTR